MNTFETTEILKDEVLLDVVGGVDETIRLLPWQAYNGLAIASSHRPQKETETLTHA